MSVASRTLRYGLRVLWVSLMLILMPAVEAGRREVGWLVFPSEWRGGVVGLTRGEFRSMVKMSWAEEAVCRH